MTNDSKTLGKVVQIDDHRIQDHLGELVRGTVEEMLNGMLDAEADALCGAQRYERSPDRVDTRAGSYERSLHTKAGEVTLKVPKLRRQTFETAIIERYRRRHDEVGCSRWPVDREDETGRAGAVIAVVVGVGVEVGSGVLAQGIAGQPAPGFRRIITPTKINKPGLAVVIAGTEADGIGLSPVAGRSQ